jgi:hypothetical protein
MCPDKQLSSFLARRSEAFPPDALVHFIDDEDCADRSSMRVSSNCAVETFTVQREVRAIVCNIEASFDLRAGAIAFVGGPALGEASLAPRGRDVR